jgi:hypothetical protein
MASEGRVNVSWADPPDAFFVSSTTLATAEDGPVEPRIVSDPRSHVPYRIYPSARGIVDRLQ